MQSIQRSAAFIKRRNFLLMLPLLVLPFVVILFSLFGGGKGIRSGYSKQTQTGLNLQLPDAHFLKKKEPDKFGLYEASARDSDKIKMALRSDPYRTDSTGAGQNLEKANALKNIFEKTAEHFPGEDFAGKNSLLSSRETAVKEKELMDKLNRLKDQLNKPGPNDPQLLVKNGRPEEAPTTENIPGRYRNVDSETDPEISQLNKMLDKVLAIQHPQSFADLKDDRTDEKKSPAYAVSLTKETVAPGSFGNPEPEDSIKSANKNRFYELMNDQPMEMQSDNAIRASIPENQILVSGSTIKLRLLEGIRINGHLIPRDQLIYGVCSMNNERLKIQFSSIRCANSILPVALEAYDLDGLAGIFIPGSISRDGLKQSGDQAMNSLSLATLDPSIGAQAASAGIQTAKTLLSHKVKLVKVTVKAGYQVLLKESRN